MSVVLMMMMMGGGGFFLTGESGLGKSTLVNSLFLTDLYKDRQLLNAEGEAHLWLLLLLSTV